MKDNTVFVPYTYRESRNGLEAVSLPSELFKDRKLFVVGEINDITMGVLMQSLICLDKISNDPIELYINSPGGEVTSGLACYRYITECLNSPVHTYCIGTAASMGAILFLAGSERYMFDGTEIMIHDPSSVAGSFEKPDQLKDRLEILENIKAMICGIIADRTGQSIEEITEITKRDAFYSAEKAVDFGLATNIIRKETV